MSEMVERVARAICRAWLKRDSRTLLTRGQLSAQEFAALDEAMDRCVDSAWADCIGEARAAIATIDEALKSKGREGAE